MLSLFSQTSRAARAALFIAISVLGAGCASGTLGRLSGSDELPKDLPKEVQDRFEIRESDVASATPTPAPVLAKPEKGKKKKGAKVPTPKPGPFTIPYRRIEPDPLWVDEVMEFELSFLGIPAARFEFTILPYKMIGSRKTYHMRGNLTSLSVFNMIYKLNDQVESFMDYEGLFSHRYHLVQDESGQSRDQLELYDSEKGEMYYWNRQKGKEGPMNEQREFAPIQPLVQDYMSAFYSARSKTWKEGSVYTFPMAHEKKQVEGLLTYIRRESIHTILGDTPAIVLRPQVREGGQLKGGEIYIWVSDDTRRVLLRLEAKVRIGTVIGWLRNYSPGTPPELSTAAPTPAPSATPTLVMPQ